MPDRIRVGFVGAGELANSVHYPSLASFRDVEIAAICDLDEKRLNNTAEKYGVENRFRDYRLMLDKVSLDAVYVVMAPLPTGHYIHAEPMVRIVIECLRRGKHVFIEKPPGVTVEETKSMAKAAEESGCKTMVGFNRRFAPYLVRALGRAVELGGEPQVVASAFHKNGLGMGPYYRGAIDILSCDAVHAVDLLCHICGRPRRVVGSRTKAVAKSYPDTFLALVEFESGAEGVLLCSWTAGRRIHWLEVHCTGSTAWVNLDSFPWAEAVVSAKDEVVERFTASEAAGSEEFAVFYGYFGENRHFIDCVKEGRKPVSSMEEAARVMDLVEAIYRAAS